MKNEDTIVKTWAQSGRDMHIKHCFYPGCDSKDIIKSHVFQNNGVLTQIAVQGDVYMPKLKNNQIVPRLTKYGRKVATIFTGFCGKHDKELFQPIEDADWKISDENVFLFFYRTFASQFQAKQEFIKRGDILCEQDALDNDSDILAGYKSAVNDFNRDKSIVDRYIVNRSSFPLKYITWKFDQRIKFAFSGFQTPTKDFEGKTIQSLHDKVNRHIFLTVLPHGKKAIAMLAWLSVDDKKLRRYTTHLRKLSLRERKQFISNMAITTTDDLVLSPEIFEHLTRDQKDQIEGEFGEMNVLAEVMGVPTSAKSAYEEIGLNLFDF